MKKFLLGFVTGVAVVAGIAVVVWRLMKGDIGKAAEERAKQLLRRSLGEEAKVTQMQYEVKVQEAQDELIKETVDEVVARFTSRFGD